MKIWVEATQVVKYRFFIEADNLRDAQKIMETRIVNFSDTTEYGKARIVGNLEKPKVIGCWESMGV